jgi:hypothetical protein
MCRRACPSLTEVRVLYKLHKTEHPWVLRVCRLHAYPTFFDHNFCGEYLLWFWPTDYKGRPVPTCTVEATSAVDTHPMGLYLDWYDSTSTYIGDADPPGAPLLPLLGALPCTPDLTEALDHSDWPEDSTDPAVWSAFLKQLTTPQRNAVHALYNTSVDITQRNASLDALHLGRVPP